MFNKEKRYYSLIDNKCCNGRLVLCIDENNNCFLQCDGFVGRFATLEEIKALGWDRYLENNKEDS